MEGLLWGWIDDDFWAIDGPGRIVSSGRILMVQHILQKFHNLIALVVPKRW